eukprot:13711876-Heterocapsa_arctica.AAC.1
MRLLFAARAARPDLQTAIVRLAKHITKWRTRHDRALAKVFSCVNSSLGMKLTGPMPVNGMDDARL